ncbi:MAG: 50S ribosomal protein L9 [Deltaproteobacteria bacterium]|nr:50S ribosomal protein L9 [Deltaproteobacteria bacterium]
MKVILTQDVPDLGEVGAVVEVARGYARNYLIPQGKALEATTANLARFEQDKTRLVRQAMREREAAQSLAQRFEGLTLTIAQRVGEADRLYGSVTAAMIAEAILAQGLTVDKKQVELSEPIKTLGTYAVNVRLAPQLKAQVQVKVVPESA